MVKAYEENLIDPHVSFGLISAVLPPMENMQKLIRKSYVKPNRNHMKKNR